MLGSNQHRLANERDGQTSNRLTAVGFFLTFLIGGATVEALAEGLEAITVEAGLLGMLRGIVPGK